MIMGCWSQKRCGEGKANTKVFVAAFGNDISTYVRFSFPISIFCFKSGDVLLSGSNILKMKPLETKILSLKGKMVQRVVVLLEECYLLQIRQVYTRCGILFDLFFLLTVREFH